MWQAGGKSQYIGICQFPYGMAVPWAEVRYLVTSLKELRRIFKYDKA